jgi:hypothetical protein
MRIADYTCLESRAFEASPKLNEIPIGVSVIAFHATIAGASISCSFSYKYINVVILY